MYYSLHTQQWEECPLDPKTDCGRNSCKGCHLAAPDCEACDSWVPARTSGPVEVCYEGYCSHEGGTCAEREAYIASTMKRAPESERMVFPKPDGEEIPF